MFERVTTDAASLIAMMAGMAAFALAVLLTRIGRGAAPAGGRRQRGSLIGVALQAMSFGLIPAGPLTIVAYRSVDLPRVITVALLMIAAVALFACAARAMGANWAIMAKTRADHQLVTWGPFAWVRNPIYLAMALVLFALAMATNRAIALTVAIPLFAIGTWVRIRAEERLLRDMFGEDYGAYAKRVKRIIPGVL